MIREIPNSTSWSLPLLHRFLSLPMPRGNQKSAKQFTVASILVHVLLFFAIFDIYFTSPVLTNIGAHHRPHIKSPPARRLVFIVSDGLRAHTLFHANLGLTPFLRDVVARRGRWGVSHTRVPTESRPGHVALIAGIYEDVASVTRGWQENAVEFDSLFNRSRGTWSWGSPDIVPMFARGAVPGRVHWDSYPPELEDFSQQDTTKLDTWVLDKVGEFLRNASGSDEKKSRLRNSDGLVFFLHLLGVDTSGHSNKPGSEEYEKNVKEVDRIVEVTEKLFEEFFEFDGRTAYVFTSDHGMTDWGSHGAGLDFETMTPLVAWGAGFREAAPSSKQSAWNISTVRSDVDQADVCPLMAAVLGLEFPANSVGRLPLTFFNVSVEDQMQMARANAFQMLEQFRMKRRLTKEASLAAFFSEFSQLTPSVIESHLRDAATAAQTGYVARAIEIYEQLVSNSIEGLYYFHRYDRFFSGVCVTAIFLLWIVCLIFSIIPNILKIRSSSTKCVFSVSELIFFASVIFCQLVVLVAELRPPVQWLYRLVPVYLLWCLYRHRHVLKEFYVSFRGFLDGIVVFWGLELLIWSFFHRFLLSVVVVLHCVWQYGSIEDVSRHKGSKILFAIGSLCLSVFPLLPVIGGEMKLFLVYFGSLLTTLIVISLMATRRTHYKEMTVFELVLSTQIILNILACIVHYCSHVWIQKGDGLPLLLQITSWSLFAISAVLVFAVPRISCSKYTILSIWLATTTIFTLLSIFYETLFLLALYCTANAWIVLQKEKKQPHPKKDLSSWLSSFMPIHEPVSATKPRRGEKTKAGAIDVDIVRNCFSYMTFLILCFFGTGNIASINSFDPRSVYCFLTIFNPFLMGALMMTKIVLPMFLTTCLFVTLVSDVQISLISQVTMILADFMALHFFFLIRDWGSWLEIGTSISHYVISMAFTVVVALFLSFWRFLLQR